MTSGAVPGLPLVPHWIGGKVNGGSGERVGDVFDPSTGKLTKQVASRPRQTWTRRSWRRRMPS